MAPVSRDAINENGPLIPAIRAFEAELERYGVFDSDIEKAKTHQQDEMDQQIAALLRGEQK